MTIRRAVVEPYLAGYQAATEHQSAGVGDSKVADTSTETKGRKDRLTEYRLFFRQQIVTLYSQPPVDFEELERLVSESIPDKSAAQEIFEADEFKSLRAQLKKTSKRTTSAGTFTRIVISSFTNVASLGTSSTGR